MIDIPKFPNYAMGKSGKVYRKNGFSEVQRIRRPEGFIVTLTYKGKTKDFLISDLKKLLYGT